MVRGKVPVTSQLFQHRVVLTWLTSWHRRSYSPAPKGHNIRLLLVTVRMLLLLLLGLHEALRKLVVLLLLLRMHG